MPPRFPACDHPTEFAHARGPIPAIGGIARVYVVPNISITGEVSAFKIPDSIDSRYNAHYIDFDLYGTLIDIETDESMDEIYRVISHYLTYQGVYLHRAEVREQSDPEWIQALPFTLRPSKAGPHEVRLLLNGRTIVWTLLDVA